MAAAPPVPPLYLALEVYPGEVPQGAAVAAQPPRPAVRHLLSHRAQLVALLAQPKQLGRRRQRPPGLVDINRGGSRELDWGGLVVVLVLSLVSGHRSGAGEAPG